MDITDTLAPTSDQLDAIELVAGPRTFQIESVSKGDIEQPVNVHFVDFPRPWRPSKGMRRVLAACWGVDASKWAGRRVKLFFDPEVTFGKEKPGGTRIAALSHIDRAQKVPLLISRGKSAMHTVDPLTEPAPEPVGPTAQDVAAATQVDTLRAWWKSATPDVKALIEARVTELTATPAEPDPWAETAANVAARDEQEAV